MDIFYPIVVSVVLVLGYVYAVRKRGSESLIQLDSLYFMVVAGLLLFLTEIFTVPLWSRDFLIPSPVALFMFIFFITVVMFIRALRDQRNIHPYIYFFISKRNGPSDMYTPSESGRYFTHRVAWPGRNVTFEVQPVNLSSAELFRCSHLLRDPSGKEIPSSTWFTPKLGVPYDIACSGGASITMYYSRRTCPTEMHP
jgi:glucan phosphoethanolaminetransferase (alkaline phosphatase superfamily)